MMGRRMDEPLETTLIYPMEREAPLVAVGQRAHHAVEGERNCSLLRR